MLGWMLNRGGASAGASGGADDTLIDAPDTPAPVFAARALKTAIFGTPAPARPAPAPTKRDPKFAPKPPTIASKPPPAAEMPLGTPAKQPQSIMLTPGVGTARRKRVSFGRDVVQADGKNGGKNGLTIDDEDLERPRVSSLTEKLENAREFQPQSKKSQLKTNPVVLAKQMAAPPPEPDDAHWDDVLDEEDDDMDRDQDVTVDLNEPHSRSGRYWKNEYQRYHDEARDEMEKLVKYKQLAKSYAKSKDAQAVQLNQRLSEEQVKLQRMEAKVDELTRQLAASRAKHGDAANSENADMLQSLSKQTALAVQYSAQVKELEALIRGGEAKESTADRGATRVSPRTSQTLFETQRQLKRAREQVEELRGLKDEHRKLKTDLRAAEKRALEMQTAKERVEDDLRNSNSKTKDLTSKLAVIEERVRRKTDAMERLQEDYDKLREESRTTARASKAALKAKDDEIALLKRMLNKKQEMLSKTSEGNGSSDRMSEDLHVPYSKGPLDADYTMDVTQLGDLDIRASRRRLEETKPEDSMETSGWDRRLEELGKELQAATPAPKEKMKAKKLQEKLSTWDNNSAADPLPVDKYDFTQRLNLCDPNEAEVSDRNGRPSRRATVSKPSENVAASLVERRRTVTVMDDSTWSRDESPIRDRFRSRSRQRAHSASRSAAAARPSSALSDHILQDDNFTCDINDDDFTKPIRDTDDDEETPRPVLRTTITDRRMSRTVPQPAFDTRKPRSTSRTGDRFARPSSSESEEPKVDLLEDRFRRLGGGPSRVTRAPAVDSSVVAVAANTTIRSTTTMPADRHAAASLRLEQRRAERWRRLGVDKENIKP